MWGDHQEVRAAAAIPAIQGEDAAAADLVAEDAEDAAAAVVVRAKAATTQATTQADLHRGA